jgi:hypothetical protein
LPPSPWPICTALSVCILLFGFLATFEGNLNGHKIILLGFLAIIISLIFWFAEVVSESVIKRKHSEVASNGLKLGFMIFIISEIMLFGSFFGAYFYFAVNPAYQLGGIWPPLGIVLIYPWGVALLNTVILLTSGYALTAFIMTYEFMKKNSKNNFRFNLPNYNVYIERHVMQYDSLSALIAILEAGDKEEREQANDSLSALIAILEAGDKEEREQLLAKRRKGRGVINNTVLPPQLPIIEPKNVLKKKGKKTGIPAVVNNTIDQKNNNKLNLPNIRSYSTFTQNFRAIRLYSTSCSSKQELLLIEGLSKELLIINRLCLGQDSHLSEYFLMRNKNKNFYDLLILNDKNLILANQDAFKKIISEEKWKSMRSKQIFENLFTSWKKNNEYILGSKMGYLSFILAYSSYPYRHSRKNILDNKILFSNPRDAYDCHFKAVNILLFLNTQGLQKYVRYAGPSLFPMDKLLFLYHNLKNDEVFVKLCKNVFEIHFCYLECILKKDEILINFCLNLIQKEAGLELPLALSNSKVEKYNFVISTLTNVVLLDAKKLYNIFDKIIVHLHRHNCKEYAPKDHLCNHLSNSSIHLDTGCSVYMNSFRRGAFEIESSYFGVIVNRVEKVEEVLEEVLLINRYLKSYLRLELYFNYKYDSTKEYLKYCEIFLEKNPVEYSSIKVIEELKFLIKF